MAPGSISELSLSDAVAFRVDFDGIVPPTVDALLARPGAWPLRRPRMVARPACGQRKARARRRRPRSPTRSRSSRTASRGCSRSTCRRACRGRSATTSMRREDYAFLTRDQQLLARTTVSQVLRYQQLSVLRASYPAADDDEGRDYLRLPARGNPLTLAFASRAARARTATTARSSRPGSPGFAREPFVYTLDAAAARPRPGRHVPVRVAARLLRALRGRVRGAHARRRRSRRAS